MSHAGPGEAYLSRAMGALLGRDDALPHALVLLEHLVARGDLTAGGPAVADLVRTAVAERDAGEYSPAFLRPETARRLVALDHGAFGAWRKDGRWWIWPYLDGWSQEADPARFGIHEREGRMDAWAAEAIASLPRDAFSHPDAHDGWAAVLRLGLPRAAQAFAMRVPGQWLARDSKGVVVLRRAHGTQVWQAALDSGLDPAQPAPGGTRARTVPLWREMLPAKSAIPATPGSLREGVEAWLSGCIQAGHPHAADMLAHKVAWLGRWMRDSDEGSESAAQWRECMGVLAQQPDGWLAGLVGGLPAWAVGFFNATPGRSQRWAKALADNPAWRAQTGALGELVLALWKAGGVLESVDPAVASGVDLAQDSMARKLLGGMCEEMMWEGATAEPEAMTAWLDARRLEARLAGAGRPPSHRRL